MILQSPFLVIAFAALLHASYQLGVSLLTLLSGHSLGAGRSFARLMKLNVAYLFGAAVITILLFTSLAYIMLISINDNVELAWLVLSILNIATGLAVMIFYYRKAKGTGLWLPRAMALYLTQRTKKNQPFG